MSAWFRILGSFSGTRLGWLVVGLRGLCESWRYPEACMPRRMVKNLFWSFCPKAVTDWG
jgi:hypothetical protein